MLGARQTKGAQEATDANGVATLPGVAFGDRPERLTLRLATSFDQLEFKHAALAFGVSELPLTW